jgi:hypothetical protein
MASQKFCMILKKPCETMISRDVFTASIGSFNKHVGLMGTRFEAINCIREPCPQVPMEHSQVASEKCNIE